MVMTIVKMLIKIAATEAAKELFIFIGEILVKKNDVDWDDDALEEIKKRM